MSSELGGKDVMIFLYHMTYRLKGDVAGRASRVSLVSVDAQDSRNAVLGHFQKDDADDRAIASSKLLHSLAQGRCTGMKNLVYIQARSLFPAALQNVVLQDHS